MNKSNFAWLALAVIVAGLGATQLLTVTAYPQREPGIVCYVVGQSAPDCPFNPALATQQAPTQKATVSPTVTAFSSPVQATETKIPSRTPSATIPRPSEAPSPTATPLPPLLVNGDFELPNHEGWNVFHLWEYQPTVNDERGHPESRVDGAQSLRLFNEYRCWLGGVYQTVSVQQLSTYVFSAHGRTWASYTSIFPSPSDLSVTDGVAVGVDPNGGTNPNSTAVIWAEQSNTENWQLIQVQFTALANHATVFIRARLGAIPPSACQWPLPFMTAFIDGASLAVVP